MNEAKSCYEIGENTYTLAENFVLTDSSDLDNPVVKTENNVIQRLKGCIFPENLDEEVKL